MKNLLKAVLAFAGAILLTGAVKTAYELKTADAYFDKGTFQEALTEYAGVEKNADSADIKIKALLRQVECLGHLFRYEEAAQKLKEAREPDSIQNRIRLRLFKAEFLRNSLLQYGNIQPEDIIEGAEGKETIKLTRKDTLKLILTSYLDLYKQKTEMKNLELKEDGYLIDTKNVDFDEFPSVYEFFTKRFVSFLLEGPGTPDVWPKASEILKESFDRPFASKDPGPLAAAELLNEAAVSAPNARVKEAFNKERMILPYGHMNLFDIKDLAEDRAISDYRDQEALRLKTLELLLACKRKFTTAAEQADVTYRAAGIYREQREYKKALELLKEVTEKYAGTYTAYLAAGMLAEIEKPYLCVTASQCLPPAKNAITVETKNLKEVYFRAYAIDYRDFKKKSEKLSPGYGRYYSRHNFLTNEDIIKKYVMALDPVKEWKTTIAAKNDYEHFITKVEGREFGAGLYVILASEEPSFAVSSCRTAGALLNVTDLMLVATRGFTLETKNAYGERLEGRVKPEIRDNAVRFYALNGVNGEFAPGTELNIDFSENYSTYSTKILKAGVNEPVLFDLPAKLDPGNYCNHDIYACGKRGSSNAFIQTYFNWTAPNPISIYIITDRPIYRPGDRVNFKVIGVRQRKSGFSPVTEGTGLFVHARDANEKDFFDIKIAAGPFGSAGGSFIIPAGKLLGTYHILAACQDAGFSGNGEVDIKVEEYKRPEYEVELKVPEKPLQYGEIAEVKGEAKYYFGGAAGKARVKYTVRKQKYVPRFCWWGEYYSYGFEEAAAGEVTADEKGLFTISFKAEPVKNTDPSEYLADITRYTVETGARDEGGREINASVECYAGKNGFYGFTEVKKNFFFEREEVLVTAKTLTVNETPYSCKAAYEIFSLKQKKIEKAAFNNEQGLDQRFRYDENGKLAGTGEFETGKDGKAEVNLGRLASGAYRAVFTMQAGNNGGGKVSWTKSFIVAGNTNTAVPVELSSICLAEREEYKTGETAALMIGASPLDGNYYCEIYSGEYFVKGFRTKEKLPVRIIEVPVTGEYKGGFSVRWFGVKELELGGGSENCKVLFSEKKLKLEMEPFAENLTPGKEQKYGIKVLDSDNKPVAAEVLAFMYDRSLEYYAKNSASWLDVLWGQKFGWHNVQGSLFYGESRIYNVTDGIWEKMLKLFSKNVQMPREPSIRSSERTWLCWSNKDGRAAGMVSDGLMESDKKMLVEKNQANAFAVCSPASLESKDKQDQSGGLKSELLRSDAATKALDQAEARKDFAATAFFIPHLMTNKEGRAEFNFKAPEQVTSWSFKAFAFTGEILEGAISREAATKKDLMVRIDLPRFFREKDKGAVQVFVHNETEKEIAGELKFDIFENGANINARLLSNETLKKFIIKPHSLASFEWRLSIPAGITDYKFRASAAAGELADAEEREIPILPSRERLIDTAFTALYGSETGTVEIRLKEDPTRINEFMQVQVEPQMMLTVMNALPFLVDYPYECVEQTLNKFVPLAITNAIYEKYPEVKKAVAKLPVREGRTAPWDKDDPKRLVKLMETPWLWESEGRKYCWPVIDMFDPGRVAKLKEEKLEKLKKFQLPSGGFPWFEGGQEDFYMTLLVLDGFAEAGKYGVAMPVEMINKALAYINRKIPEYLKAEEEYLSTAVYAAHVVTSFSGEGFHEAKKSHEGAAAWAEFIDKNIYKLTPFGKAYLASVWFRLKNEKRGNEVLDMALDESREDKIAGVYWAPEKYSWIWYSDSVEKHAFFLKLLSDFRPEDKRIKGMVQWLLLNKKGNSWKSTRASAAAIYSILNFMDKTGALASNEAFTVKWGRTKDSFTVKSDEFLEKPVRLEKRGMDITSLDSKAEVAKEGKGFAFASMTWIYSTDRAPESSAPGLVNLDRKFYLRVKEGEEYHLKPLNSEDSVKIGDEIEVYLKINTNSPFEYMQLKDPKPAGFEAVSLLSGWKYDKLSFYEEQRDSLTNFFISRLPHGEFVLRYKLKPTKAGTYKVGAAVLQSMYSPDMAAHSSGFIIRVE